MYKLNLFKLLYFIFLPLIGNKLIFCTPDEPENTVLSGKSVPKKTVVNEVHVLEVGLAKTVHCIDYHNKAILQCKPKHVLVVHAAQWSNATCTEKESKNKEDTTNYLFFNRTETLQQLCDGLSYCFLKPSRTRDEVPSTFLGDPLVYHKLPNTSTTNNYSLTVSVSCLNRELSVRGRKVTDTFDTKNNNVDFGCNGDELIHLSVTRVDGYSEDGPNRLLTQYNYGPYVFDCNLKQKCTVKSEHLSKPGTDSEFVFGTGVLVYYCRRPMKFSFCDHVVVKDDPPNTTPYDKFVLYAEQDSQVTVKAPMFYVLNVKSATWSTPDKLTDETVKKDRTELLRFMCENRNYCAFTPKRSAAGALDSSYEEVHFGGMLLENKSLVLLATFTTKHVKDLDTSEPSGFKTTTTLLTSKLSLECKQEEEGTLHVLSAVAGPKDRTDPKNYVESDAHSVKFKDLTKVLHKICYRKKTCEWNLNPVPFNQADGRPRSRRTVRGGTGDTSRPASTLEMASMLELSAVDSSSLKTPVPNPSGGSGQQDTQTAYVPPGLLNQEITVKYMCKKYTHDPSLVDSSQKPSLFLQMSDALSSYTSTVHKEQAETVSLGMRSRLFINLEVFSACTVTVGDFFTIKVPDFGTGKAEAYFNNDEATKFSQSLTGNSSKYVLYLGFSDETSVDFAMDVSDGVKENHYTYKLSTTRRLVYPINLKDVVKATGGIVGMRVYIANR